MREIKTIFIIGSGFMGAGIAQVAITAGYQVKLNDLSEEILIKAKEQIDQHLEKKTAKGKMSAQEKAAAMDRLTITTDQKDAAAADLVIEAVIENVEVKKTVFRNISEICGEDTILASNTSSIPIAEIASCVKNPSRFVGMHFFSPVPVMKLLEIVKGVATGEDTVATARQVGETMGKVCIVSKDRPAFIVNRLLDPMLNEAIELLENGTGSVEDIDNGAKYGLNHPMGPLELLDMVGIDIELAVMEVLLRETGDPKYRPSALLRDMVRMGWLGRKTGIGFYQYHQDGSKTPNPNIDNR